MPRTRTSTVRESSRESISEGPEAAARAAAAAAPDEDRATVEAAPDTDSSEDVMICWAATAVALRPLVDWDESIDA
jgi:hypothetical protein